MKYLSALEVGIAAGMECAMESPTILRFVCLVTLVSWERAATNAALTALS